MNIRCNQKFVLYKDHGIDFSINNNIIVIILFYVKIK